MRCDAWLPVDRDLRGAATQINSTGRCLPGAAPGCWRADNITWGFTPDGGRIMQNARACPESPARISSAVLHVWLGEQPADAELRHELLGSS